MHFLNEFEYNLPDSPNLSRMHLSSLKKRSVKGAAVLNENLSDASKSLHSQWFLMSLDFTDSKVLSHPIQFRKKHNLKH